MKAKGFDCMEMKRQGAKLVMAKTAGMTLEEELAFWHEKTEELREMRARRQERRRRAEAK